MSPVLLELDRDFEGVELRRSYSICAGKDDGVLQVGIKRVDGGAFSTWANENLKAGDVIAAFDGVRLATQGIADYLNSQLSTPNSQLSLWPADAHVIGKDIIKFHAVYWPIMLKAMNLPLPKQLLVHGWWQKDGAKMSKSTGNVVDPVAVIDDWGLDAFRYYVVRELDIGPDGNWTDATFAARYQAELANGLGNLVNRSLSMLKRYRGGVVAARSRDDFFAANAAGTRNLLQAVKKSGAKPKVIRNRASLFDPTMES